MKKKIIKITSTLLVFSFLGVLQSCDPTRTCSEPKCIYTDVTTEIQGVLSGNLDSVIHIGDTIKFSMKIPDTMITNHGNVIFGTLLTNSYFGNQVSGGDTLVGSGEGGWSGVYHDLNTIVTKSSTMPSGKKTWDYNTREYECLFIATEKGRYIIDIYGGRLEMTNNENKGWAVNPTININSPKRYTQYLSWMTPSMQSEALSIISKKKGWYCFEVK